MGRISLEITAVFLTVVTLHLKATSSSSAIKSTEQTVNKSAAEAWSGNHTGHVRGKPHTTHVHMYKY